MGSGGGGSQNTVTQSTEIPAYEQQFSQEIQGQAQDLASQAFPVYQGPLQASFTPQELESFNGIENAATAQDQYNNQAMPLYGTATQAQTTGMGYQGEDAQMQAAGANTLQQATQISPTNSAELSAYMSPYVQQALQPQILQMQTQLGQQQNATNASMTEGNAFGSSQNGVEAALNNYYGDQSLAGIESAGYNTAFTNALNSMNQQQQNLITAGQAQGALGSNFGTAGMNVGTLGNNIATTANNLMTAGQMAQNEGITGSNALYDAGQVQQNQQQQALNMAYQQYENQVLWPYQMLSVEESGLSNSPYDISNQMTLPQANSTASAVGNFSQLAGSLGSLLSGSGSGNGSANTAPFGSPTNSG